MKVLIQCLPEPPDVIAITEFKPKKTAHQLLISEFNLDGYNVFHSGLDNNNDRGVLFYIAQGIQASPVDIPSAFNEFLFLILKNKGSANRSILLGNIYRSPSSSETNNNELCSLLDFIQQKFPIPKLVLGDFNFANINWYNADGCSVIARCTDLSQIEQKFINTLNKNFLIQHVSEPTRQRGLDVPHILDLVISSDNCLTEIEHLSPLGMSDHSVLMFKYEWSYERYISENKFQLDRGDYDNFRKYLDINWDEAMKLCRTVDDMWEYFKQKLLTGMTNFIPRSKHFSKNSKKNFQPFNLEFKKIINKKHRLWKRWISTKDKAILKEYKKVRNQVKRETVKLTQQEQHRISLECKRNPKKFWQYINKRTASRSNVGDLKWVDSDGNENQAETDSDKAAALQQYFSSVYTVEPVGEFDILSDRTIDGHRIMNTLTITEEDIYNKLSNLKTDKSPGLDMIHPRVLFEMRDVIKYPLFLIYNKSLQLGALPYEWKLAEVTAIYKKGQNRIEVSTDPLV